MLFLFIVIYYFIVLNIVPVQINISPHKMCLTIRYSVCISAITRTKTAANNIGTRLLTEWE